MKSLLTLFISLISMVVLLSACSMSDPTEADKIAIQQLITNDFKNAWDANDEVALAAIFTEDASLTFPTSNWIRGREAIQNAFHRPNMPEGLTINLSVNDLRFLDGKTAVVDVDASFTGGKTPQGEPIPAYWDSATSIFQKVNGTWKQAMLRVMPMRQSWNETEKAITDTWEGFAENWHAGNVDGFMDYYTEDADNLGVGMPDQLNKGEIRNILSTTLENQKPSNLQVEQQQLDIMGPVAYQYVTFSQTWTDKAGISSLQQGHMMCRFQLEPDGIWRFQRCLLTNQNPIEN